MGFSRQDWRECTTALSDTSSSWCHIFIKCDFWEQRWFEFMSLVNTSNANRRIYFFYNGACPASLLQQLPIIQSKQQFLQQLLFEQLVCSKWRTVNQFSLVFAAFDVREISSTCTTVFSGADLMVHGKLHNYSYINSKDKKISLDPVLFPFSLQFCISSHLFGVIWEAVSFEV